MLPSLTEARGDPGVLLNEVEGVGLLDAMKGLGDTRTIQ